MANIDGTDSSEELFGTGFDDTIRGFAGNDTLFGLGGNDLLIGGLGADTMVGSGGNDIYVVDNVGDIVTEGVDGGFDTVRSSVSYTLSANVERLLLSGGPAINGTGNNQDNEIVGNNAANELSGLDGDDVLRGRGGNDILTGGLGTDTLQGDEGNDTYNIGSASDVVIESAGEGFDTVRSSVSYTLTANIERLLLIGGPATNGTGNDIDNIITGNDAANMLSGLAGVDTLTGRGGSDVLNGGLGADVMDGGMGNDDYVVDNSGDVVIEASGSGFDTVRSSVDYQLTANVERLLLTGGPSIEGIGNDLNNVIVGNNAANRLVGFEGDDILRGRGGNDLLVGAEGNDTFVFDTALGAGNVDVIADFSLDPDVDTIQLDDAIFVGLAPGALDASAFRDGGEVDADDRILYDPDTGVLSFDADGSGEIAAVQFATLANMNFISSGEFMVV